MADDRALVGSQDAQTLLGIKRSRLHALVSKGELVPVLRMPGALCSISKRCGNSPPGDAGTRRETGG